jgi:hypothetical protein
LSYDQPSTFGPQPAADDDENDDTGDDVRTTNDDTGAPE